MGWIRLRYSAQTGMIKHGTRFGVPCLQHALITQKDSIYSISMTMAEAPPPPLQIPAQPYVPPVRLRA